MTEGFSLIETLLSLALSMILMFAGINTIMGTAESCEKIGRKQDEQEEIFHVVDLLRKDLATCGMRLSLSDKLLNLNLLTTDKQEIKITYGISDSILMQEGIKGSEAIEVKDSKGIKKDKQIIIQNFFSNTAQKINVLRRDKNTLILEEPLQYNFSTGSSVILIKEISYKWFKDKKILKRKVDKGYFQPLMEGVSDFTYKYFADNQSLVYKMEINKKAQVRGYIFLNNMVTQ